MIRCGVAVVMGACVGLMGVVRAAEADELRVGAAVVEITPEVGQPHYRGESTGVHDPLHVRAMVFERGGERAAVAVCDVLGVTRELTDPTRELAVARTGIAEPNIVVAATHTHTGPRGHNALDEGEGSYAARVRDAIVEAIEAAQASARPARAEVATAFQEPTISFNRRFHMSDGSVRMNPGLRNPEILRPEGPIDPEVGLLLIRDAETDEPFASFTNFALHLDTVGGNDYSADYPYYIHRFMGGRFGDGFVSVFGTGCCGDVNHLDVTEDGPQRGHREGYQTTQHIGEALCATIGSQLLPELRRIEPPALAVRREVVRAPLQRYTDEELAWAHDAEADPLVDERPFLVGMRRRALLSLERLHERWGERMPLEVQVIGLGDEAALVFIPGEVFVELGVAIKAASPFEHTFVVELANDNPAYIPTRRGFANGDYEAVNSRVVPGSGERMVQAAARVLLDLHEQARERE